MVSFKNIVNDSSVDMSILIEEFDDLFTEENIEAFRKVKNILNKIEEDNA